MRFLLCVLAEGTELATPGEMAAIDAFNETLEAAGRRIMAVGLEAPAAGGLVDARGAGTVVADGLRLTSGEHLAGFWIVDVPDRATALALAAEGSRACDRRVEVRAFLGG